MMHSSIVLPQMDYASIVWGRCPNMVNNDRISKLQKSTYWGISYPHALLLYALRDTPSMCYSMQRPTPHPQGLLLYAQWLLLYAAISHPQWLLLLAKIHTPSKRVATLCKERCPIHKSCYSMQEPCPIHNGCYSMQRVMSHLQGLLLYTLNQSPILSDIPIHMFCNSIYRAMP